MAGFAESWRREQLTSVNGDRRRDFAGPTLASPTSGAFVLTPWLSDYARAALEGHGQCGREYFVALWQAAALRQAARLARAFCLPVQIPILCQKSLHPFAGVATRRSGQCSQRQTNIARRKADSSFHQQWVKAGLTVIR